MSLVRKLLIIGLVAGLLLAGGTVAAGAWLWQRAVISTAGRVEFVNPMAVPPLAPSRIDAAGRRVFDLTAQPGTHDFGGGSGGGRVTRTWGYNGDYLGPTLRASRGEQVVVNVTNSLAETTTVHWHGMRLPAVMDGGPHQPIEPGATWSPTWRINQPAATLWYHPHPHGQTERHVYRGLAGMFIVDDGEAGRLGLPHRYGVDDFPVIVQDKTFSRGGELDDRPALLADIGTLGDTVTVNGTIGPYLDVTTDRVRLRLLNGSTARTYNFGFADGRRFDLIGTDGGLLAAPHRTDRVMLSPGERAEIVVSLSPGDRPVLRSYPPPLGLDPVTDRFVGGDDTLDTLQLRAADELAPRPELPAHLAHVPRLDPAAAARSREFRLSGRHINGRRMDMNRIDFAVSAGAVEIWRVRNDDGNPHNFHVHDMQFQVLSVDGEPPPPSLAGWKDTIYLPPGVPIELIGRFGDHTDPGMPYMVHCHLLRHEDGGMMSQFVVVEPGQAATSPPTHHDH